MSRQLQVCVCVCWNKWNTGAKVIENTLLSFKLLQYVCVLRMCELINVHLNKNAKQATIQHFVKYLRIHGMCL